MRYKVTNLVNDTYQVTECEGDYESYAVFQGSISDCEAYIRLKQNEDVEFN